MTVCNNKLENTFTALYQIAMLITLPPAGLCSLDRRYFCHVPPRLFVKLLLFDSTKKKKKFSLIYMNTTVSGKRLTLLFSSTAERLVTGGSASLQQMCYTAMRVKQWPLRSRQHAPYARKCQKAHAIKIAHVWHNFDAHSHRSHHSWLISMRQYSKNYFLIKFMRYTFQTLQRLI